MMRRQLVQLTIFVVQSRIQHPSARFFICWLNSGSLLLVKYDPIAQKIAGFHLTAFVFKDDSYFWSDGLLLDEPSAVPYAGDQ